MNTEKTGIQLNLSISSKFNSDIIWLLTKSAAKTATLKETKSAEAAMNCLVFLLEANNNFFK